MIGLLDRCPIVPVVVLDDAAAAVPLGAALLAGGVTVVEVTLRTPAARNALKAMAAELPDLHVGAGTVLAPAHVDEVVAAGARFVVSPGLAAPVLDRAAALGVPALPGVATATELTAAVVRGITDVKLFPAGLLGGPAMVRALSGPFPQVRFLPSGGVGRDDVEAYLSLPCVPAVSGSWMVAPDLVAAGRFDEVTARCAAAVAAGRSAAAEVKAVRMVGL